MVGALDQARGPEFKRELLRFAVEASLFMIYQEAKFSVADHREDLAAGACRCGTLHLFPERCQLFSFECRYVCSYYVLANPATVDPKFAVVLLIVLHCQDNTSRGTYYIGGTSERAA